MLNVLGTVNADLILNITSNSLSYMVTIPSGTPKGSGWPILCFLHGRGEAAPMPIQKTASLYGPLNPNNPAKVRNEFIIVVPQLSVPGDDWHLYSDNIKEMIINIRNEYGGDANRTFLTGFSWGANGVFDLGIKQPDFWTALWPVDPVRMPTQGITQPIWLSIGAIARKLTTNYIQQLDLKPLDSDLVEDRYYLDEGDQDHVGCAKMAYKDDRTYEWMLRKRLDALKPLTGSRMPINFAWCTVVLTFITTLVYI